MLRAYFQMAEESPDRVVPYKWHDENQHVFNSSVLPHESGYIVPYPVYIDNEDSFHANINVIENQTHLPFDDQEISIPPHQDDFWLTSHLDEQRLVEQQQIVEQIETNILSKLPTHKSCKSESLSQDELETEDRKDVKIFKTGLETQETTPEFEEKQFEESSDSEEEIGAASFRIRKSKRLAIKKLEKIEPESELSDDEYQPSKKTTRTRRRAKKKSKVGCWICRLKHKRCDERKPSCGNCSKQHILCDYSGSRPFYLSNKELRRVKLKEVNMIWLNRYKLHYFLKGDNKVDPELFLNNNSYDEKTRALVQELAYHDESD